MGAMLTGSEIYKQFLHGTIEINPFDPNRINPNSYDLHIGNKVTEYQTTYETIPGGCIDPVKGDIPGTYTKELEEGERYIIYPNKLYLIPTKERVFTERYVPLITGRSSIGRYGISVHQEAGFGDIGFNGHWTLCLTSLYPFAIYPGMRIAQIYFLTPEGSIDRLYHGKYQNADGAIPSRLVEDFRTK